MKSSSELRKLILFLPEKTLLNIRSVFPDISKTNLAKIRLRTIELSLYLLIQERHILCLLEDLCSAFEHLKKIIYSDHPLELKLIIINDYLPRFQASTNLLNLLKDDLDETKSDYEWEKDFDTLKKEVIRVSKSTSKAKSSFQSLFNLKITSSRVRWLILNYDPSLLGKKPKKENEEQKLYSQLLDDEDFLKKNISYNLKKERAAFLAIFASYAYSEILINLNKKDEIPFRKNENFPILSDAILKSVTSYLLKIGFENLEKSEVDHVLRIALEPGIKRDWVTFLYPQKKYT